MKARLSIVAGLIVGVAVAGLMLGGLLALAPDPPAVASPTQPLAIETPSPSPTVSIPPTASPSASPSPSASSTILPGVDVTT
jgi:hypothetical protein